MKRLLLLLLLFAGTAFAQTTVNVTVTDTPDNQTWNNGSWSVIWVPVGQPTQQGQIISGGGSLNPQAGALSASGTVSVSLPSNINIIPAQSVWKFTVCPQAASGCFDQTVSVGTTSPQTLNITPPSPRVGASVIQQAYNSAEVSGGVGSVYFDLDAGFLKVCSIGTKTTCSSWTAIGGGGGGGVSSFNGRTGSVVPALNDYNLSLLGGGVAVNGATYNFGGSIFQSDPMNLGIGVNGNYAEIKQSAELVWDYEVDSAIGSLLAVTPASSCSNYGCVQVATTSTTSGIIGITQSSTSGSGVVSVAHVGHARWDLDTGSCTIGEAIIPSTTTNGYGHCTATPGAAQVVAYAEETNTGSTNFPVWIVAASSSSGGPITAPFPLTLTSGGFSTTFTQTPTANRTLTFPDTSGTLCTVATCPSGTTTSSLTANNSGSGAPSGSAFNGSGAITWSWNTFGASPLAGSSSLNTVGTISTGVWQGSVIGVQYGGTGQNWSGLSGLPQFNAGVGSLYSTACSNGLTSTGSAFGCQANPPLSNVMTTLGDAIIGGAGGVPTRLPVNTTSVPELLESLGGNTGYVQQGYLTRDYSGTSDTIAATDNISSVTYTGAASVIVALGTPTSLGNSNFAVQLINTTSGSATTVTVNATTLTFQTTGTTTLVIPQGQTCSIRVDPGGTYWQNFCHDLPYQAGSNITISRGQYGPTISASGGSGNMQTNAVNTMGSSGTINGASMADGAFVLPVVSSPSSTLVEGAVEQNSTTHQPVVGQNGTTYPFVTATGKYMDWQQDDFCQSNTGTNQFGDWYWSSGGTGGGVSAAYGSTYSSTAFPDFACGAIIETGATASNFHGLTGPGSYTGSWAKGQGADWTFWFWLEQVASAPQEGIRIGFGNGSGSATSPIIAGDPSNWLGLRAVGTTSISDFFFVCYNGGTAGTSTDTGVALSTGEHALRIHFTSATSYTMQLDRGTVTTVSTGCPSSVMFPFFKIDTSEAVDKHLDPLEVTKRQIFTGRP
jgi:hypothetical protein